MRVPEHPSWSAGATRGHKQSSVVMSAREVWGRRVYRSAGSINHSIGRRNLTASPVCWVCLRVGVIATVILIGIVVVCVHVRLRGLGRRWHDLLLLVLLLHRQQHLLLLLHLPVHHLLSHHHVPTGCLGVGWDLRLTDVRHLHLGTGTMWLVPLHPHPHPSPHPLTPHQGVLAHGGLHGDVLPAGQFPVHHVLWRVQPTLVLEVGYGALRLPLVHGSWVLHAGHHGLGVPMATLHAHAMATLAGHHPYAHVASTRPHIARVHHVVVATVRVVATI